MKTTTGRRFVVMGLGALFLLAGFGPVAAQIPDEFKNLKVLPKDIGKRDLVEIMRNFAGALGARCTECHPGETPGSLEGVDFASDELEAKKVARAMMKMVDEINGKLIPATGLESPNEVRCVTCHRGLEHPESLDRILLAEAEEGGAGAAGKAYRELREEYYGSGSYAFGPGTLNSVAETLARERNDVDGAVLLLKLNLEFHSETASSHMMLGQLYQVKGDKAAAIASITRAVELSPDNPRAKQMLERLRSSE